MKAIWMVGGTGSRLWPMTLSVNKHMMPIYSKPMSHYSLSSIMLAGIKEVIVVCDQGSIPQFNKLYGDGSQLGMKFSYVTQYQAGGIAEGIILAKDYLEDGPIGIFLGDNVFYGSGMANILKNAAEAVSRNGGSRIFAYEVADPSRYGVVSVSASGRVMDIAEKPAHPKSNLAVPGVYFFDKNAVEYAQALKPSARGELEITDLIDCYLKSGGLYCDRIPRGVAWLDTGTFSSLADAADFVRAIETRQGFMVCSPEEIAYENDWITQLQLRDLGAKYSKTPYGSYLLKLAAGGA